MSSIGEVVARAPSLTVAVVPAEFEALVGQLVVVEQGLACPALLLRRLQPGSAVLVEGL